MKIGLQTWGSYGDVRPFLALAEGLQSSGHDTTLAITSIGNVDYRPFVTPGGADIRMVATPVLNQDDLSDIEGRIFGETDPIKQTQIIIEELLLPAESAMYAAAEQLCEENDLVIGHFFNYPLNTAAERYGKPYASVALVHSTIPSALHPPSGMPDLGAWGNRIMWSLAKSVLNRKLKKYADQLRKKHGLLPARDLMEDVWASRQLTLVAVSPQICEPKRDWPEYYQVCGFLNTQDAVLGESISDELKAFVSSGPPPVYMTFGSVMSGGDQAETIALLVDAAARASVRAIIQASNWRKAGFKSSPEVHFVDSAPYTEIFPQCQAIVHHGGAGTLQTALLAGKPSVVVTHTSEQEFWGRELARIGAASKPLSRRGLKAGKLARHIELVTGSKATNEAARRIGAEMANEDGVATAIRLINEKFST
jgi:UDP:flavonoid glycosyltransferase YjiC (YdhE family)